MKLTGSDEIEAAAKRAYEQREESVLADVVSVEFDDLIVIPEGTPKAVTNEYAGMELVNDKYYTSSQQLFLFRKSEKAVLAAMVASDVFNAEIYGRLFGPAVRLVPEEDSILVTLQD